MTETVRIVGLSDLKARLLALPAELASNNGGPVREAVAAMARPVRDEIKATAPVLTGLTRDNVVMVRDKDPRRSGMTERYIITVRSRAAQRRYANTRRNRRAGRAGGTYEKEGALYHARFYEFGTSRQRAKPWFRRGFESRKGELPGIFQRRMTLSIARAVRKLQRGRR